MRAVAAVLALCLVAAGCFGPDGGNGTGSATDTQTDIGTGPPPLPDCDRQDGPDEPASGDGFDGEAALAWVEAIVFDGSALRPRIPVDSEATCTAAWLGRALHAEGWVVGYSNFTGAQYRGLPKGSASSYADEGDCPPEDWDELDSTWFHNVYALREGTGARTLLLAAHWDQKEDASDGGTVPGANDGASGIGLLLEFQRHVVDENVTFPFDVAIALFDGEDGFEDCHPLAGSIHFAETGTLAVDRMILLDMVGDAEARFPREIHSRHADEGLQDLIWERAPDHGLEANFVDTQRTVIDDHRPFIDNGVPAVDIIDFARSGFPNPNGGFPPYWHTTEDTPDKLDAGMLGSMGELLLDVLQDPAFVDTWPEPAGA